MQKFGWSILPQKSQDLSLICPRFGSSQTTKWSETLCLVIERLLIPCWDAEAHDRGRRHGGGGHFAHPAPARAPRGHRQPRCRYLASPPERPAARPAPSHLLLLGTTPRIHHSGAGVLVVGVIFKALEALYLKLLPAVAVSEILLASSSPIIITHHPNTVIIHERQSLSGA